jgi:hypothetical protein
MRVAVSVMRHPLLCPNFMHKCPFALLFCRVGAALQIVFVLLLGLELFCFCCRSEQFQKKLPCQPTCKVVFCMHVGIYVPWGERRKRRPNHSVRCPTWYAPAYVFTPPHDTERRAQQTTPIAQLMHTHVLLLLMYSTAKLAVHLGVHFIAGSWADTDRLGYLH